LKNLRSFGPDLPSIRRQLELSHSDFNALLRAIRDTEEGTSKTPSQHEEDETWLDWAIKAAKKYGPQIAELIAAAA